MIKTHIVKKYQNILEQISSFEEDFSCFNPEDFKNKTKELKETAKNTEQEKFLKDFLPQAIAVCSILFEKTYQKRYTDEEKIVSIILNDGKIIKAQESDYAITPIIAISYLNSLIENRHTHITNTNIDIIKKYTKIFQEIFSKLDISFNTILENEVTFEQKVEAYKSSVIYTTPTQLTLDYTYDLSERGKVVLLKDKTDLFIAQDADISLDIEAFNTFSTEDFNGDEKCISIKGVIKKYKNLCGLTSTFGKNFKQIIKDYNTNFIKIFDETDLNIVETNIFKSKMDVYNDIIDSLNNMEENHKPVIIIYNEEDDILPTILKRNNIKYNIITPLPYQEDAMAEKDSANEGNITLISSLAILRTNIKPQDYYLIMTEHCFSDILENHILRLSTKDRKIYLSLEDKILSVAIPKFILNFIKRTCPTTLRNRFLFKNNFNKILKKIKEQRAPKLKNIFEISNNKYCMVCRRYFYTKELNNMCPCGSGKTYKKCCYKN
ncbi:MAG: SEC-C domain-containing protein [bacterium]|nr:SEC-C domain-containing protein [bacterium]